MNTPTMPTVVDDELTLLQWLVRLRDLAVIELGCGKAELARLLVVDCPGCSVAALRG
jgi:hypothetical protein